MRNTTLASSAQIWGSFVEKSPRGMVLLNVLTFLDALFVPFFFVSTLMFYKDNSHEIKNH